MLQSDNPNFSQYYSIGEAAEFLGVTTTTLRNWDRHGKLKPRRHPQNGHRIYLHEDLEAVLRSADRSLQPDDSFAPWADWSEMGATEHFVQFYETDKFLVESVSGFVSAALKKGQCSVVIATPEHRHAIQRRLAEGGIDLSEVIEGGRYVVLDAAETLSKFMVDGSPDARRFNEIVGGVISQLAQGDRGIHAFGEMVALLWADGKREAALRLEELWNELAQRHRFALCCGYPIANFGDKQDGTQFESVCKCHSRVIPAESYAAIVEPHERLHAISLLQQKAKSLEAEIAHREEVEKALSARERELADFFENASEGLHKVGPDGRVLWANKAELDLLGFEPHEYIGHHIAEFHVDQELISQILERLLKGENLVNQPARLRCKNGSVKHVLIHSNAYFVQGQFAYSRCFTRDVTEMKQAEQERAILAAIIESSQDAIVSKSLDGIVRSWNSGAERLFGFTEGEALGKPITIIIPPDRLHEEKNILERLRRGERIDHYETVRVAKDGRLIDISLTISPLRDTQGNLCGASKIARDITERKRAEAALRESEERLAGELAATRRLQEISTQLIQEGDVGALCEQILDAAIAIMRSDMGSLQTVDVPEDALRMLAFRGFEPDFGKVFELNRADARTSCSVARRLGQRVVVPDVETCDFIVGTPALDDHRRTGIRAVQSTPLVSRSGVVLGVISTHWRQPHQPSDRELRMLDVLARQAADLMEQKQAETALRDADRRKDEFLATLAHELRNPLAPIRNGLALLRACPRDSEHVVEVRGIMERQVEQMTRLVDDLLDVSRITRNKIELRKERVELADVVKNAVETSRPLIDSARHELTLSLPADPVFLDADRVRMAQIFSNLLNNSAKYTEPGGRIALEAAVHDRHVVVTVRDNGIGIPCEALAYVFDMFQQANRSIERSQGGLGIGLTLVRRLVELHGGTITAQSEGPGKGSAFTVRLPIAAGRHSRAGRVDATGPSTLCKKRILVVDDNEDSVSTLSLLLRIKGNEVRTACDGQEAVEVAATFRPEIILMDVGMPKLNGYDATRQIRGMPWGKDVFIVALSGWGQAQDRERATEAGCSAHLTKPVDFTALEHLLASPPGSP